MKRLLGIVLCLGILVATPNWLLAQDSEVKSYAVLPFQIHGPDKYQYLGEGIQSMLESRLAWEGHFVPVDNSRIQATSAEIDSESRARDILQNIEAQFLFWGDVTILSEHASVDLNILESRGQVRSRSWETPLNDLIPSLETQSKRISQEVFDREVQLAQRQESVPRQKRDQRQKETQETGTPSSQYIEKGDQRSGQIERTGARDSQGRWMSQRFSFESKGAVVGDGDGDGENEVFILTNSKVYACKKQGDSLEVIAEYKVSRRLKNLTINLIELNGDQAQEIVVSAIQDEEKMQSFILNFRDGELDIMQEGISRFVNVVSIPPEYEPVLLAQKFNSSRLFYGQVHKLRVDSGKVRQGEKLQLPDKVNVSNLAYLPVKDGYKITYVNIFDKLSVVKPEGEVEHVSNKKYALSTTKLPEDRSLPGLEETTAQKRHHYIPARLTTGDFNGDGHHELLVNRNISTMANLLPNLRRYSEGEVHSLFWDGVGLSLEWKTKPIQGTVIDYGIADLSNNGSKKLYVCLNTYPGLSNLKEIKTMLLTYSIQSI